MYQSLRLNRSKSIKANFMDKDIKKNLITSHQMNYYGKLKKFMREYSQETLAFARN